MHSGIWASEEDFKYHTMKVVFFRPDSEQVYSVLTASFASDTCGRRGITSDDLFHFIFPKAIVRTIPQLPPASTETFLTLQIMSFVLSLSFWKLNTEPVKQIAVHIIHEQLFHNGLSLKCLWLCRRVLLRMLKPATGLQCSFHLAGVSCNFSKILILSAWDLCHPIGLLLTCMVMDMLALVADPHFSRLLCHSFFPLSISLIFSSPQLLFSFTLSSPTINCLPPFCIPPCLTLSWLLTSPFVANCAPSSSSQTTSFFFLSASGCRCPVCMNTVWGWSCFPRGSACWRSPRRSSSAWRPWSSSASVSLLGQCLKQ